MESTVEEPVMTQDLLKVMRQGGLFINDPTLFSLILFVLQLNKWNNLPTSLSIAWAQPGKCQIGTLMDILNQLANSITVSLAVGKRTALCEDISLPAQQRARLQCAMCVGSVLGVARLLVPKELVSAFQTTAAALFTYISWVENGPIKRKDEQQYRTPQCLVDWSGQRRVGRLLQVGREATAAQISTRDHQGTRGATPVQEQEN